MPEDKKVRVAIVGGGFAGLALAIGLQQHAHITVNVYEGAHQFAEIGAGIVLGPNAQYAMDKIDTRIREGYNRRAAFGQDGPDQDGQYPWMKMRKGQEPDAMKPVWAVKREMRGSSIHRAHFLDELVKLVHPDAVHFGKRLERIEESADPAGPVRLHFRDGSTAVADVLFGADGVHSVTRRYVLGEDDPAAHATFMGSVTYRATIPMDEAQVLLGREIHQGGELYCGTDGTVVTIPMARNTLYHLSISCHNTGVWPHDEQIVKADVAGLKDFFKDWDPWIQKNVSLLPPDDTLAWSVWDMPPARTFYRGRVAMLGDAAHATSPFQGAGAGQAIEDASVLTHLVGKLPRPSGRDEDLLQETRTVGFLLQAYDAVRRFRAQKIVSTSREMARIVTGREPGQGTTAQELHDRLQNRFDWIYDLDQGQQIHDALLLFEQLRSSQENQSPGIKIESRSTVRSEGVTRSTT